MYGRELITCRTEAVPLVQGSAGRHKLLIPDGVVLGMPSGDEYRDTLDDGNIAEDKGLPGVRVTRGAGVRGTIAASWKTWVVEIRTVLGQWYPWVSTNRGPRRGLGVFSSAPPRFAPSCSVSGSVLSPGGDI